MKKIFLLGLVFILSMLLVGCGYLDEYVDTHEEFCESDPLNKICNNSDDHLKVIVLELFNKLLNDISDESKEFVCEDYFDSDDLLELCQEDHKGMLPEDYLELKEHLIYISLDNDYFEVDSRIESTQDLLYVFKMAITLKDEKVRISTFTYTMQIIKSPDDLKLESSLDGALMEDFNIDIDASLSVCEDFTYGKAKIECGVDVSGVIGPYINNPSFSYEKLDDDARYKITKKSEDGLYEVVYVVLFVEQNGVIKVSDVNLEVFEHFNNQENAKIVFINFLNQLKEINNIEEICEQYAISEESREECAGKFVGGRANEYEIEELEFEYSRNHEVECRDDDGNSLFIEFAVRITYTGEYKLEFFSDDDSDDE